MSFDPGGGTIASEGDVALSNPANGQALTYNGSTAKWSNHTFTATDVGALSGIESATAPSSPVTDQLWYDSTNDLLKRWDGTAWVASSVPDATATTRGVIQLAGDLGGTAAVPTVPGLATKADDSSVVHNTGAETVAGVKTFSSSPVVPTPTGTTDAANKGYVDSAVGGITPGSTTLAGDNDVAISSPSSGEVLTYDGTSSTWKNQAAPTAPVSSVAGKTGAVTLVEGDVANLVSDLAAKVPTTRTLTAGTGLSGGGDLSADRTLSVTNDSTTQKIEVAKDGTLQATRKRINFVAGSNVSISAADDTANNKVDVTIAASATSSPQRVISWEDAGDGSTLSGVQAASGLTFIRTARTASEVAVALDAAPTAGPVTYQINKNGSSWLTISVSTGQTTATTTTFSNGAALAVGDTFTVARTAGDSTPTQANIVITGA